MAAGLASAICEPTPVLLYHYAPPKLLGIAKTAILSSSVAKFKSNLRKQHDRDEQDNENNSIRKNVRFASARGESSEKFLNIINKLDKALKEAQDPTRNRSRQQQIARSLSLDVEKSPRKSSRPNSASPSSREKPLQQNSENSEDKDIINHAQVPKKKSRSPRTFIENRLDELVHHDGTSDENSCPAVPSKNRNGADDSITASENRGNTTLLSPSNLPKPRRRVLSSKIPIRCQPDSPQKNSKGTQGSAKSLKNSPSPNRIVEISTAVVENDEHSSVEIQPSHRGYKEQSGNDKDKPRNSRNEMQLK